MKATEIKQARTQFWETKAGPERKHGWASPASLIVNNADDPTTMFNTAGMQPLVPYLMGKDHPAGKRVYNIQGCIRTIDIEEVGDASHLTYFEMMGNWSLGDYFRKESVAWSREFLTQRLKLDPKKICVTVFEGDDDAPRDEETAKLWRAQGVPDHKISYLNKKENRRGPAGATGPCGPDTEIFYRVGEGEFPPETSNQGTDEENRVEIWNNVFMAYYKDEKGEFSELSAKNVDTGMGFERIAMVCQHASGMITKPLSEASVYDTDIFVPIMKILGTIEKIEKRRIVADHARTAFQLIQEGLIPSNEGRGYVLRRLIRRMYFQRWISLQGTLAQFEKTLLAIKKELNALYEGRFSDTTIKIIREECEQFAKTIRTGQGMMQETIEDTKKSGSLLIAGETVFKLYDTYGFPVELAQEIAQEAGLDIDQEGFERAMKKAQEKSRQGGKDMFAKDIDWATVIEGVPQTSFSGYDQNEEDDVQLLKDLTIEGRRVLIFDKTPFYAESGGQKGDSGTLIMDDGSELHITDVQKYGGVWLHFVQ